MSETPTAKIKECPFLPAVSTKGVLPSVCNRGIERTPLTYQGTRVWNCIGNKLEALPVGVDRSASHAPGTKNRGDDGGGTRGDPGRSSMFKCSR